MAKIPSMNDLSASVPGMLGKVKSFIDSFSGPANSEAAEAALADETDPFKKKILEVELLIRQLQDVQLIQTKTLEGLKSKYADLRQTIEAELVKAEAEPAPSEGETVIKSVEIVEITTEVVEPTATEEKKPLE